MSSENMNQSNVLGNTLEPCSVDPMTGFYRNGYCCTGPGDTGLHTVCVVMTPEFLKYSKQQGNDLTTPQEIYNFPGLSHGDRWCLCLSRWIEAFKEGRAPRVILESTHISVLEFVDLETLKKNEFNAADN